MACGPSSPSSPSSPFVDFDRASWAKLGQHSCPGWSTDELEQAGGVGAVDPLEIREVYLPLARLITLHMQGSGRLYRDYRSFLGATSARTPFVIGVAGPVSVGKSAAARLLRLLIAGRPPHPRVELMTTDGFLHPNAELERRGLLARKGFPESYDRRALLRFVTEVKAGRSEVSAPVYSHLAQNIISGERAALRRPDILLLEGLNVLQPAQRNAKGIRSLAVSDFIDFSVYLDAATEDVGRWYVERYVRLRETTSCGRDVYLRGSGRLDEDAATARAEKIWAESKRLNLEQNIRPTRDRADLVLRKGRDRGVTGVRLRKP